MASFDTGRLCAIVKILDKASSHLRLAARECAVPGAASAAPVATSVPTAPTAPAVTAAKAVTAATSAPTQAAPAASTAPAADQAASAIVALLRVSEHASSGVRRALVHIRNGEAQRARDELATARVEPSGAALVPAGIAQPLPPRVTTALHLMLGITGFFPSETEQVLARAAVPPAVRRYAAVH
ncbi:MULTISPECIES: hypothetical protein [unclassified Streptomyces]|uniref:hypothetical protein n=1 Tax=unclassified Streptomyces TaxID=2593676 RepID=UPI000747B59A|nr:MULTISPECIES: hypothetical protein [unclassified Streptomyces]KUL62724.1 hypothetical protein ADL30_04825 [Streptomyces sp. NRRL S-1521]THC45918.1 hypothetical protein E7X58_30630 [Streptomyces sp. A1499]